MRNLNIQQDDTSGCRDQIKVVLCLDQKLADRPGRTDVNINCRHTHTKDDITDSNAKYRNK